MSMLNAKKFGSKTAILIPEGKEFRHLSYAEMWKLIGEYSSVLVGLGLKKGEKLVLLGENSVDWILCDHAAQSLGIVTVPIYPTLPADQALYIAKDCEAKFALCSTPEHAAKLQGIHTELMGDVVKKTTPFDHEAWEKGVEEIDGKSLATIIYTSGTSGEPKGAMLTHQAFLTVYEHAMPGIEIKFEDVFFSFLPISHVFERMVSNLCFYSGATLAISKSLASMATEFTTIKPTIMAAVPRFLESFMDRILDGVRKQPPMRQKLFHLYLSQGVKRAKGGFAPLYGVLDGIVGVKIRERLGGRLVKIISGGAALPKHVAEFYLALRVEVLQGYGLTETTGGSCCNRPGRNKYWTIGEPLGVEMKIAEDGEILMRGPTIMLGYYNLPEATAEAIDSDGWFHTGDIGEMEGAAFKITDRKKDILVLGNGKNVAPLPIENKLKSSPYIVEAVVLGDGMDHCIGLIIPNAEAVRAALSLPPESPMTDNPEVRSLLKKEIDAINKSIAHFEMVKKWGIIEKPFSIETGELTPKMSVKRKVVKEKYAGLIKELGG
jgi:long-chain acyl-CoA synthetase